MYKNKKELSIHGDLDGITVGDLRKMLEEFSDDATVTVDTNVFIGMETHYEVDSILIEEK